MSTEDPRKLVKGIELFRQAQAFHAAGALQQAATAYAQATALMPNHPDLLIAYGSLAEQVKDWAGAERIYRRLMAVKPVANLDGKLGEMLLNQGRHADAIPLLDAYARRNPRDASVRQHLAQCCLKSDRADQGVAYLRDALRISPDAETYCLLLEHYVESSAREELDALLPEALARFPNDTRVRGYAAVHLLKSGNYARGFDYLADMRVLYSGSNLLDDIPVPTWNGQRFEGTLLVCAEQGIGDEILDSSTFHELVAMGQDAVIEADARLLPVFARSFPSLRFIERNSQRLKQLAAGPGVYRKLGGSDLPALFRRDTARFPSGRTGWLVADGARAAAFQAAYTRAWPAKMLVGLSWKSQRGNNVGPRKSISLTDFAPLLDREGTAFVSLQYGDIAGDLASLGDRQAHIFVDPSVDPLNDIDTLFAQVAALDRVITTSNVTAHIAGALGKPCVVLLPRKSPVLWYWGYAGETTPWYPSLRLLREDRSLPDLPDCINRLAAGLPA